jgi:hypothetical protein
MVLKNPTAKKPSHKRKVREQSEEPEEMALDAPPREVRGRAAAKAKQKREPLEASVAASP